MKRKTTDRQFERLTAKLLKSKKFGYAAIVLVLWFLLSVFAVSDVGDGDTAELQLSRMEAGSPPADPLKVRVCSWNVKNYNVSNRYVKGKWREYPKPEEEKAQLRKVVAALKPDVLLIQEMGDMAFLDELRADLAREGVVYPYCAVTKYNSPSRLAIMSKIRPGRFMDFSSVKIEVQGENRMSPRGALGAEFESGGVKWCAFALHLKSKQGARKRDEAFIPFRFAEIRGIDEAVFDAVGADAAAVIAGDFNDEPSAALLRNFKKMPFRLVESVPEGGGRAYTYYWQKGDTHYLYDFFLATPGIQKYIIGSKIGWHLDASDHRPVYIDLDFGAL